MHWSSCCNFAQRKLGHGWMSEESFHSNELNHEIKTHPVARNLFLCSCVVVGFFVLFCFVLFVCFLFIFPGTLLSCVPAVEFLALVLVTGESWGVTFSVQAAAVSTDGRCSEPAPRCAEVSGSLSSSSLKQEARKARESRARHPKERGSSRVILAHAITKLITALSSVGTLCNYCVVARTVYPGSL